MTNDITTYGVDSAVFRAPARRAARTIAARQTAGLVRQAAADADTDLAIVKVEDYTMAMGATSAAVVRVAQAQRHLEQLVPEASGRLAFLADEHLLGCAELLADLRRDLRRR
ncbi:MAG: hypothetical protein JWN95_443 [Frankiales bacterium]|nr:hypothetical protein [Frankiales bacterium]